MGQERAIGARNGVRSIVVEHPLIELAGQIELPVVPCAELRAADWGNVGHVGTGRVAGRVIALVDDIVGRGPRVVVAPREHALLASGRCGELEFVLAWEKPAVPDAEGVRQRPVDAVYGTILVLAGVARPGRQVRIASEAAGGQAAVVRRVPSRLEQARRAAVLESTAAVKVRVLAPPLLRLPLVAAVLAAERGDELTETADRHQVLIEPIRAHRRGVTPTSAQQLALDRCAVRPIERSAWNGDARTAILPIGPAVGQTGPGRLAARPVGGDGPIGFPTTKGTTAGSRGASEYRRQAKSEHTIWAYHG